MVRRAAQRGCRVLLVSQSGGGIATIAAYRMGFVSALPATAVFCIVGTTNMGLLPLDASDDEVIAFVDRWSALLEAEDYAAAYAMTGHDSAMKWTPELVREAIKAYGEAVPTQKVTLHGQPTDITQRKNVTRWETNHTGTVGEIWYDLNIDGFVSDLTATFYLVPRDDGLELELNDIHVM